ncbi:MAG: hypothetical protein RH860_00875 [Cytophagales bacterium]
MKNKTTIIILSSIIVLVIIFAAYRINNSGSRVKSLNTQLYLVKDSLGKLQMQYSEIQAQYEDIREELDRSNSKLLYVKNQLDTMTSRRMQTFTEVQAKLIELKLSLGKIQSFKQDSAQFRFE